ncbi:ABC transporter ATP-binding protein [Halobellus limi]|uniref:ABC transporter ATP-binding protein n=1 Tax=Halobellus limi TaxID=699433 RepID=A0A1H5WTP0_9EURY|nr:ABC transporter ATP-binding protein [Halobellus limi]QCC46348.1 ABC transporter ATP-binding protein [Halobellus limi]SEG02526.1 branched-chain amino acid transport system ATP-binding protein [Halobellus limi]
MLTCRDLTVGYGETPILRDVDLTVDRGEIVGVIGKNGVGKTTLMKALVGLLDPSAGSIEYDGTDVTGWSADERARAGIGYIPQSRDVFPDLTVEQNLLVGEAINETSEELLYETVYDYFPILEERADQRAGSMSGGEQQMLAIARALVGSPDLLLLDEPSEGIQPSIVQQIQRDIPEISDDLGITVLFVEQNLGVIEAMSDRCYAIERGTIVDELGAGELTDDRLADFLAV